MSMPNIEEDNISELRSIGPGDILSFGSVNLLFTLNLEKEDISKYELNWDELESLRNLNFITKHKSLWKRIELSSTNDTINLLLQINQSSKKLLKIGYVGFKKITYKDEQVNFCDFIESITRQNGLYITSCDVCKSTISIQLLLKYKNKQKIFLLSGISTPITNDDKKINNKKDSKNEEKKNDKNDNNNQDDKDNKENIEDNNDNKNQNINQDLKYEKENKSEEEDQDNPLSNITDDVINPGDFSYLYFNFTDFTSGEFSGRIKIEHLYEFFQHLKVRTKSKIILNLNDEIINNKDEIIKDLLSITDMFIFYNKNKLYDILKQMKEIEDQSELKRAYEHHYNQLKKRKEEEEENKEKEKEFIDNYKNFLEKEKMKKEKRANNSVKKDKLTFKKNNIYITQNNSNKENSIKKINQLIHNSEGNQQEINNQKNMNVNNKRLHTESNKEDLKKSKNRSSSINLKNIKIRLMPIKPSAPKPLDKKEMFDYFKCGICDKDPQKKSQDKVALVLDEFKKVFFIKCNKKDEKPSVLDFDLKLYPQMNLRNMKEILESKKCIQSNFNDYSKTFFGSLLNTIVSKGSEGIEENSLFLGYLVAMNTIKKMVEIQKYNLPMPKNKEFFSSSINRGEIKKMLTEANQRRKEQLFVLDGNTKKNIGIKPYNPLLDKNLASFFSSRQNFLKINGFIGKDGEIMYDPLYRDTLQNTNQRNKNTFENKFSYNSPQRKKNKKVKENNKNFKYKSMTTNKFLFGFRRKSPGYSIYNESRKNNLVLPFITIEKKKRKYYFKSKSRIKREKSEEEDSDGINGSMSGNDERNGSGKED